MLSSRLLAACLSLSALVGCGGNVVVDSGGAGGGGTSTSPSVTCASVCPKLQEACPGKTDGCDIMCGTFSMYAEQGACLIETGTYFACLDLHPTFACNAGEGSCATESEALAACLVEFCMAVGGC